MCNSKLSFLFIVLAFFSITSMAQVGANDRDVAHGILRVLKDEIKGNYYDPTFHGVDIEYVWEQANARVNTAPTRDALMMAISSAVLSLDDSHTTFFPPSRAAEIEYGWKIDAVGNDCFVTAVRPKSDAEIKGLKVGDRVLGIDGVRPTRDSLWRLYYRIYAVMPVAKVIMTVVEPGQDVPHTIEIQTKIDKTRVVQDYGTLVARILRHGWDKDRGDKYVESGDLMIWRMSTFETSESSIDTMMSKARGHKTLILDLRENGGGYVDSMKRLLGYFFDKDVNIGVEKTRKTSKPLVVKTRGKDVFKGNLIVLVGHESASASEIFSKVIQLEKRGKILGDRSMGGVMESKFHDLNIGVGYVLYFGVSLTVADIIMSDGKSLEKVGVTPDEIILPTGEDLLKKRDPLLTYAAKMAGVELSPEKAGSLFPYEWSD